MFARFAAGLLLCSLALHAPARAADEATGAAAKESQSNREASDAFSKP